MSHWTHIRGIVIVSPFGETQAEKTYVLDTVLSHLPKVTGSEKNMVVTSLINPGYDLLSSHDELNNYSIDDWIRKQSRYTLVLNGDLRDREYAQTYRELIEWLYRLAKRISVEELLLKIDNGCGRETILSNAEYFCELFEYPSWSPGGQQDGTSNRFEYLTWERDPFSGLPLSIIARDYDDPEVCEELERRRLFRQSRIDKRT